MPDQFCDPTRGVVSRREFLKLSGAAMIALTLPPYLRKSGMPETLYAQQASYPRQAIAKLSAILSGDQITFRYPWDHPAATNMLIKLSEPAGGGIGANNDIVAFNTACTHQGGPLAQQFHADLGVAGPCPLHWTTFDLNRHGMVISGHATQGLPQITLDVEGNDIIATGVLGLIYSYHDNLTDPTA